MKKSILLLAAVLMVATALSAQSAGNDEDGKKIDKERLEGKDYLPKVNGTIRAKYEYQTGMGAGRFEVRNARVSLTGNILPIVAYKAEIDLSDEGQIKMLDAYARIFPAKGLTVTAGQMRVPFTIDAHRSPHQQYFANRSFIAKQVGNVRDVGLTLGYELPARQIGRRTLQRHRLDEPEGVAQGSELLCQGRNIAYRRTEPHLERAGHQARRGMDAFLRYRHLL